jgi:hypothetical protein
MILYRTKHTGINAHDGHLVYATPPAPQAETDIVAIDIGEELAGYTVGGPDDDCCMVFDSNGRGYALRYDKDRRTILLTDSANQLVKAISATGKGEVVA